MKRPKHIKIKIRLLQKARVNIEKDNARGVCYAVSRDYAIFTPSEETACIELKNYISVAIDGYGWLDGWQQANGFGYRTAAERKQDRLDWIDWMIADYKKWGAK